MRFSKSIAACGTDEKQIKEKWNKLSRVTERFSVAVKAGRGLILVRPDWKA